MAELWDVYTEERVPTGRLQQRGLPIPEGEYHLVVNIWVVREDGRILLTRRDPRKPYGGWWETTGGSVVAGEDSLQGALRETEEETGICLRGLHPIFLCSEKRKNDFLDTWLFFVKGSPAVTLQEGETVDFRWVTREEYEAMDRAGEIVPTIHSFPHLCGALERKR